MREINSFITNHFPYKPHSPLPPPPPPPPMAGPHRQSAPSPTQSPPRLITTTPTRSPTSLEQTKQKKTKSNKIMRRVRSVLKAFPNITPTCRIPISGRPHHVHLHGGTRITGTLFGNRRARINLAIQENPRCQPMLILELAIPTAKLLQEMGLGLVRLALECEKPPLENKSKLIEEPIWTMYNNGRKTGYGIKRGPTEEDLNVMKMLHNVSMGAGVLPTNDGSNETHDGELTYMRAFFERVVGSKDSETYYMMNPYGGNGPELSIFFVRI